MDEEYGPAKFFRGASDVIGENGPAQFFRGASDVDGEYGPAIFMVVSHCYIFILVLPLLIDAQGDFLWHRPLPILINAGALMSQ